MLMRCSLLLTLACALILPAVSRAAAPITIESLLHEMTDRDALARFPQPAYTCAQSSSYDRDSVSPDEGKSWFANWDRSQFVRIEEKDGRKEYVLHDQDGPGALVRFWATWHGPKGKPFSNGTLRVYIDGAEKPAIEGSVQDVIDSGLLCGEPLSKGVSPKTAYAQRGHNLYLPIPYAKHCKVTYSTEVPVDKGGREGEALYYQINYRTYGKDVEVESFSMDRLAAARGAIDATNKALASGAPQPPADWKSTPLPGTIAAKSKSEPVRLTGPAAIRSMQVRLEADNLEQALRSTVLEIRFDGERTVWTPLGDFMGTGYVVSPFQTWYCSADKDGMLRCSWVMPFKSEAEIVLHNLGDQEVRLTDANVYHNDWKWDDRSMHFHSTWKQLTEVATPGNKNMDAENAEDVNYVTVQGEGVYVGDTLTLCNGAASWWGEGDEKIYVDGESFPSHFGTGTEDYYGYAWCRPESFESPLHAQPNGDGNLKGGYSVNSRYRALDAIPFKDSLKFDMELWHWAATKINYAPTTFYYAKPGATCNIEPAPEDAARPVAKAKDELAAAVR